MVDTTSKYENFDANGIVGWLRDSRNNEPLQFFRLSSCRYRDKRFASSVVTWSRWRHAHPSRPSWWSFPTGQWSDHDAAVLGAWRHTAWRHTVWEGRNWPRPGGAPAEVKCLCRLCHWFYSSDKHADILSLAGDIWWPRSPAELFVNPLSINTVPSLTVSVAEAEILG